MAFLYRLLDNTSNPLRVTPDVDYIFKTTKRQKLGKGLENHLGNLTSWIVPPRKVKKSRVETEKLKLEFFNQ